mmetsp:Transcript_17630/g.26721  ORF Transcript_17630/g.26721 Transcript_17630/m.26721 type:complete len:527 (-) Transcript_17630:87-1667(-)
MALESLCSTLCPTDSTIHNIIMDGDDEKCEFQDRRLIAVDENSVDFKTTRELYRYDRNHGGGDSISTPPLGNCSPTRNARRGNTTEHPATTSSIFPLANKNSVSDPDWTYGTTAPTDERTGGAICVDARFEIHKVSNLDLVNGTAFVKISCFCYWSDCRLSGWSLNSALPAELWGPVFEIKNAYQDMSRIQEYFILLNNTTGRLKRVHSFEGTIDVFYNNLQHYPCDIHDISINFQNYFWQSNSGQLQGYHSTYRVRKMQRVGEGTWIRIREKTNRIPNFRILGISSFIKEELTETEQMIANVILSIHVCRKFSWWPVMLPLYLLTLSSFQIYIFHSYEQVEAWTNTISLHLLAYIIYHFYYVYSSAELPKITTIFDKSIMCTALVLFVNGATPAILYLQTEHIGVNDDTMSIYLLVALITIILYACSQVVILLPMYLRFRRRVNTLSHSFPHVSVGPEATRVDARNFDSGLWPVEEGYIYRTFRYLTRHEKKREQKRKSKVQKDQVGAIHIPGVVDLSRAERGRQ